MSKMMTKTQDKVHTRRLGIFPSVNVPVFLVSACLIVGFILFGALAPQTAGALFGKAQDIITTRFGFVFVLLMNACLVACGYIALSRYGDIRLGAQTESPIYSYGSWIGMLFSAGIGIGLLYWGTAEPLFHYISPPVGEGETLQSQADAMSLSFLHWGLHAWALYCLVSLALGYFHFRLGLPLSMRSILYPILGRGIYGTWGHVVDVLAVFGTVFGVVTSLGLGVMQMNTGLFDLFGIPNTTFVQIVLIAIITAVATVSVMAGLDAGVKRLSDFTIIMTLLMLGFMIVFGPTQFILNSFVENVGNYAQNVIALGLWSEAYASTNWQGAWTIFYWAWWASWSPFVGIFIARISRGRTIREFVLGVLFVPMVLLFLWFTAFGGVAVQMEVLAGGNAGLIEAVNADTGSVIFRLMEHYPATTFMHGLIVVMILLWFVTSADSASLVVDMLTAGGNTDAPKIQRFFWVTSEGVIAIILLLAGGLSALQAAAIIAGFPFAIVVFLAIYCLIRALGRDRLILYRNQHLYITDESVEHNSATALIDEAHLKGPLPQDEA